MKKIFLLLVALFCMQQMFSQATYTGVVVDKQTNEPLIGVSIFHERTSTGVNSNLDGSFSFRIPSGKQVIKFTYIGYSALELTVDMEKTDLGVIEMNSEAIGLQDVTITSSMAIPRKTPVAVTVIEPLVIEEKLGNQEFPELLRTTPGVYVTRDGGGFGDAKTNVRGFKSPNVAVMINGVPVNDMEWGGVYWSNWAGLSDVTRFMQVQRGLGASKVSAPSVGGSINIVTRTTDAKKGGSVSYGIGNDGTSRTAFHVSTGLLDSGWAFTFLGGRSSADGYIQGTEHEGYSYFANISKLIGVNHTLSFTAFGAPQWHYQRSNFDGLTIEGWQDVQNYMGDDSRYKYNATFGYGKNGERKTSNYNSYHKPQISLNHQWQIDEKSSLSTALYTSIGRGYGYSGQGINSTYSGYWYGASNGTLNRGVISYNGEEYHLRNSDGTYAYTSVYNLNEASDRGSIMAMSKSKNEHNWYGLLSTYTTQLNENIDFYAGVDVRYYKGIHTNELIDLYGGEYYIDRYRSNVTNRNHSQAGTDAFTNQKLQVGDVVYRDYDGFVMQEGVFSQVEGNFDKLNVFVSGSVSNTAYWRYDRFYYDGDNSKSDVVNFWGFTAKTGANYNLTEHHNVFGNIGYISRAPFFSGGAFLQSAISNMTNPDAVNEKIFSVELGYGFRSKYLAANLNLYYTRWMDKTMTNSTTFSYTDDNGSIIDDRTSVNMQGVDARHQGIELDVKATPLTWLELTGMLSIGDWVWDSNSIGYFYNSGGQPMADTRGTIASGIQADDHAFIKVNLKDTPVAGSAQSTFALGANVKLTEDLRFGVDYYYAWRNFADFSIGGNDLVVNSEKTYGKTWQIPGAGIFNANVSYTFNLAGLRSTVSGNVMNLLDQEYIADAYDGGDNSWQTAYRVFYGFGRTWSMRWKVNF